LFDCHVDNVIAIFERPSEKSMALAKLYKMQTIEMNDKIIDDVMNLLNGMGYGRK